MKLRPKIGLDSVARCAANQARILTPLLLVFLLASFAHAQANARQTPAGSSSRGDRLNAIAAIPFGDLNDEAQRRIKSVVNFPSFYRKLPATQIDADPEHVRFLIRQPEVVVSIWQLMGVTQVKAQRTGPFMVETSDGAGTSCKMELIYGNNNLHVYYGAGNYAGNLLKRNLQGRFVAVVRTASQPTQNGSYDLVGQLDVFLRVDNVTAAFVTRTLQPIVGSTADYNFFETMKFVERLNRTARNNGPGMKSMNARLDVTASTKETYDQVIDQVFERSRRAVSVRQGSMNVQRQSPNIARRSTKKVPNNRVTSKLSQSMPTNPTVPSSSARSVFDVKSATQNPAKGNQASKGPSADWPKYSVLVGGPRKSLIQSRVASQTSAPVRSAPENKNGTVIQERFFSPGKPSTSVKFSDGTLRQGSENITRR